MEMLSAIAKEQYEFVKDSRTVLFEYCNTIAQEDFVNENTSFGRGGSMRNLLVHIANIYQYWIANITLKKNIAYAAYDDHKTVQDVITLFDEVNTFMEELFLQMNDDDNPLVKYEIQGVENSAKPFKIFSHAITHEYHHKGQILSISRHLGYTPADTDIIR